jgi:hypothetical protein
MQQKVDRCRIEGKRATSFSGGIETAQTLARCPVAYEENSLSTYLTAASIWMSGSRDV